MEHATGKYFKVVDSDDWVNEEALCKILEVLKKFEADNDLTVDGEYSQNDKQMMIARMMIYINNHENDKQYEYLMKIIK